MSVDDVFGGGVSWAYFDLEPDDVTITYEHDSDGLDEGDLHDDVCGYNRGDFSWHCVFSSMRVRR